MMVLYNLIPELLTKQNLLSVQFVYVIMYAKIMYLDLLQIIFPEYIFRKQEVFVYLLENKGIVTTG